MKLAHEYRFLRMFTDHMVLQRNQPIHFAGKASTCSTVHVKFLGKMLSADSNRQGNWEVEFPSAPAGGPYVVTLTGASDAEPVVLEDVMIGEVWMCSGQSNMEMPIKCDNPFFSIANPDEVLAQADNPQIRLFNHALTKVISPFSTMQEVPEGNPGWQRCNAQSLAPFSACAYFFGKKLQEDLNCTIGLVNTAWGGTRAEAWISKQTFQAHRWPCTPPPPDPKQLEEARENARNSEPYHRLIDWVQRFQKECAVSSKLLQPNYDDSAWEVKPSQNCSIPSPGRVVVRIAFDLPEELVNQELVLEYPFINDYDTTYLNGKKIGETDLLQHAYWASLRQYPIPTGLLHAGRNVIAILADNHFGSGGINLTQLRLTHNWKSVLEIKEPMVVKTVHELPKFFEIRPPVPNLLQDINHPTSPNYPCTQFNAQINPWLQYRFRGVIWYQGCTNSGQTTYYDVHKMLIEDMRKNWRNPNLPFLLVQLAAYDDHHPENRSRDEDMINKPFPFFSAYGLTREIQAQMSHELKNVEMVTAFDVGDHSDIHPRDKKTVGYRLALKAEDCVYHKREVFSYSPEFKHLQFLDDGNVRVFFRYAHNGLQTTDGKDPTGFAVGDRTGNIIKVRATLEKTTILLHVPTGFVADFVRYAYTGWCPVNVVNHVGLPLIPFRSDSLFH
ncbi:MAG: hypothetical protein IJJ26_04475 [Victivallales bacterium]|nr:hypothetical protein [Victivallales bacterium]